MQLRPRLAVIVVWCPLLSGSRPSAALEDSTVSRCTVPMGRLAGVFGRRTIATH